MSASREDVAFESQAPAAREPVARLENVSKSYGSIQALRNVSIGVGPGELVALLGPNGAGKTTAVKLLLGLARPSAGTVSVFGGDPRDHRRRVRVGAMLQVAAVPATLRVAEHIDLFSSYFPNPMRPGEAIRAAGLEGLANRRFGELSGGQKQRVLFALALCGDPDLLYLDEPTAGLDVEARRLVWEEIRRRVAQGKAVLLTTHHLEEADALAHRIVLLNRGAVLAEGTPRQIKARIAGRRIRCSTRLGLAAIRALDGVSEARQDGAVYEIQATQAEPVVRQLLALDEGLTGLEVTSTGLEEAYLALTKADTGGDGSSRRGV
ncbi:MAG TPA: ABC transporter ATP-binding protein [Candidatus Acidoferrales bacterium]|nr:ABC transporter ATP-binding protein [Candidatus Acidoferrales bacterium]